MKTIQYKGNLPDRPALETLNADLTSLESWMEEIEKIIAQYKPSFEKFDTQKNALIEALSREITGLSKQLEAKKTEKEQLRSTADLLQQELHQLEREARACKQTGVNQHIDQESRISEKQQEIAKYQSKVSLADKQKEEVAKNVSRLKEVKSAIEQNNRTPKEYMIMQLELGQKLGRYALLNAEQQNYIDTAEGLAKARGDTIGIQWQDLKKWLERKPPADQFSLNTRLIEYEVALFATKSPDKATLDSLMAIRRRLEACNEKLTMAHRETSVGSTQDWPHTEPCWIKLITDKYSTDKYSNDAVKVAVALARSSYYPPRKHPSGGFFMTPFPFGRGPIVCAEEVHPRPIDGRPGVGVLSPPKGENSVITMTCSHKPLCHDRSYDISPVSPCTSLFQSLVGVVFALIQDNARMLDYLWTNYVAKTFQEVNYSGFIAKNLLLFIAAEHGSTDALSFLFDKGAAIGQIATFSLTSDKQENTIKLTTVGAVIYAANNGLSRESALATIDFLLKKGEDRNAKVLEAWTETIGYCKQELTVRKETKITLAEYDTTGLLQTYFEQESRGKARAPDQRFARAEESQSDAAAVNRQLLQRIAELEKQVAALSAENARLRGSSNALATEHAEPCRFFRRGVPGSCRYGDRCHFSHAKN